MSNLRSLLNFDRRNLIAIACLVFSSPVFAWALLQLEESVRFRFPPGDQPTHWSSLSSRWWWDDSQDTLRNLFMTVLPDGVAVPPAEPTRVPIEVVGSAVSRLLVFVGAPVLFLGVAGLFTGLGSVKPTGLRLLFWGWTSSAAVAYTLRFFFPDLFLKQKELYWAGALLAVARGSVLAERLARKKAPAPGVAHSWFPPRSPSQLWPGCFSHGFGSANSMDPTYSFSTQAFQRT